MSFVDFNYYRDEFLGTLIPIKEFYHIESKATVYVNYVLLGNMKDTDEFKNAVCAVCELIYNESKRGGIKSENNDGYSVTFEEIGDFYDRVIDVVKVYLSNTGLLYRGIY